MVLTAILGFVAGFFAGNGWPYYAEGSIRHGVDPTRFWGSAAGNVMVGWIAFVIAGVAFGFAHMSRYPVVGYGAAALGVLAVGLIHARAWNPNPLPNPFRRRITDSRSSG